MHVQAVQYKQVFREYLISPRPYQLVIVLFCMIVSQLCGDCMIVSRLYGDCMTVSRLYDDCMIVSRLYGDYIVERQDFTIM